MKNMSDKKIVIAGAGGIGLYFGGKMIQNGYDVYFLARGETKKLLKSEGLKVESINGDFALEKVQVVEDPKTFGVADIIIVTVKTYQLEDILEQLKPMVGDSTTILPLENGVVAPTILGETLGLEKVIGGLCMISSFKTAPNKIKHQAIDPTITFGELKGPHTPRVDQIKEIFDKSEIKSTVNDDFMVPYWTKMTFITTISGIGAITRVPVGTFRSIPESRELVEQCVKEIVTVAQKSGVDVPFSLIDTTLKTIDSIPPHTTASMQRDIMNGLPSELYQQNGTIYNLGKKLGIETPINKFIFFSLLPSEQEARKKSTKS